MLVSSFITPGLWDLIISKKPTTYDQDDYNDYAEILICSNAMYKPGSTKPKSNRGWKWTNIVSKIWKELSGSGIGGAAIFLPKDPNALIERMEKLIASKMAGNTGVMNELTSIFDELLRQSVIELDEYKKLSAI